jgi:hypothetical protein
MYNNFGGKLSEMCKSNTLELAKIKILVKKTGNNLSSNLFTILFISLFLLTVRYSTNSSFLQLSQLTG